jgi:hypothetical protein
MIRCVKCGCSRLDSEKVGCVLCGGSPAVRWEQCHISSSTKTRLATRGKELKDFGLSLEIHKSLAKVMGAKKVFTVVLTLAEPLPERVLRKVVRFLLEMDIPVGEILRLRLAEPEEILHETCVNC